jgi:spore germination cell wall hydrolase CwlJ-like protein
MRLTLPAVPGAANFGFSALGLVALFLVAQIALANTPPPGALSEPEVKALAARLDGRLSDASMRSLFDADGRAVFARFDPAARPMALASLLHRYEGPAPGAALQRPTPKSAEEINAAIPFAAPTGPVSPFVLKASATDRNMALTCLTQAVYYEAGFEPEAGQQAVAQVILNRMRHPIFPHTVCGVVYQGAQLKTGCQFSFTCDGSLERTPQAQAFARARKVAERALGGFVMKSVGGATHYHTQWVAPWWAPTVTKVAQIGAHIFYRWPGDLGMPGAFNMRYAGNEKIAPTTGGLIAAPDLTRAADGKAHATLAMAAAPEPRTPRERLLQLAAEGGLGAGFDPLKLRPVAAAPAAAATTPPAPAAPGGE